MTRIVTLVDTGMLVAFYDRADVYHNQIIETTILSERRLSVSSVNLLQTLLGIETELKRAPSHSTHPQTILTLTRTVR